MKCIHCGLPTDDGSDEHEGCFLVSAETPDDECPMCGWTRGTNVTSCGECQIEADDTVGVGHEDDWIGYAEERSAEITPEGLREFLKEHNLHLVYDTTPIIKLEEDKP